MGRKKNQENSDIFSEDSEDEAFKPKRSTRSQKQNSSANKTSTASKSQKKSLSSNKDKGKNNSKSNPAASVKSEEKRDVTEKEVTAPERQEFCPICQVPLSILKISPANHTAYCNIPANLPACPDGSNCLNATIFHYRDYSHQILAAFRDSEEYVDPGIVFTPQKAKLKKTPLRSSGKKRFSKSPVVSASKICKTDEEVSCSFDTSLKSPNIPSKSFGVEESKKRLKFNNDLSDSESDEALNTENLHETDVWCSDLILSEDPVAPASLYFEPIPIKKEPSSPSSILDDTDETDPKKLTVPNAKVQIEYHSTHTNDQDIVGDKVACNEKCRNAESVETMEANCSVAIKALGINRGEAMSKSPISINLLLNNTGWEAIEVHSTNLQNIKISLCECSSSICVNCSLNVDGTNGVVSSEANYHEEDNKFFVSMVDLGLKKPLNGYKLTKDNYHASCNQIKVSSAARSVPEESEKDSTTNEVGGHGSSKVEKANSMTNTVVDAFSLMKRTSANSLRKSASSTAPLSGSNSRSSTPMGVPLVVSKTTASSWTLVPTKENKTKSSSGWAQPSGNKKVPAYKRIPDTPIVVDAFSYGIIPGVKAYFLSHFHSDHYIGLRKDFNMPIFCSQVTANLVSLKIRVDKKYLYILKKDEPRTVCGVEVEIFDANHCPGAIMFLFRLLDGRVFLHVGDFRAHSSMEEFPQLRQVDKLYLDTTYCDPSYDFPSQEEVVQKVINTVQEHLSRNKSTLIVCGTYTIGKEKVFMGIANTFNLKIWTTTEKKRVLLCLEDQNVKNRLTNDPFEAQIHVLAMKDISFETLPNHLSKYSSKYSEIVGFKPTGWTTSTTIKGKPSDFQKSCRSKVTTYGVPYSEHSSFSELRQFVRFVKPKDIQVTVNVSKSNQYKKLFEQWLSNSRDVDTQSKMVQYFSSSK